MRIVVRSGKVRGGIQRATVEQGKKVAIVVGSDVADDVHLHGYDRSADVAPASRRGSSSWPRSPAASRSSSRIAGSRSPISRFARERGLAALCALVALVALAVPATAAAHGLGGIRDLPVPGWLFLVGGAAVLVVSFVALGRSGRSRSSSSEQVDRCPRAPARRALALLPRRVSGLVARALRCRLDGRCLRLRAREPEPGADVHLRRVLGRHDRARRAGQRLVGARPVARSGRRRRVVSPAARLVQPSSARTPSGSVSGPRSGCCSAS